MGASSIGFILSILLSAAPGQDDPEVVRQALEQADKLFEDARALYERAKGAASVAQYNEAGFKAEDAKTKYRAVQELSQGEAGKKAADQLKNLAQLQKLINDGRLAIKDPPPPDPAPAPAPAPAPPAVPAPPAAPAPVPPAAAPKRAAVPDPARQRESEKAVKEVFKAEYARKTATDRVSLARTLLSSAATQSDPVERWVLLMQAQELATLAGDWELAWEAVGLAARGYECDASAMKSALLAQAAKAVKTPDEIAKLGERYLQVADDAVAQDQLDAAEKAVAAAQQLAKRAANAGLSARIAVRSREVGEVKAGFDKSRKAREALARNPEDPAANMEYGLFLCLVKGQWEAGLAMLAKGTDGPYKTLANRELKVTDAATDQSAIGDSWWEAADKETGPNKAGAKARALFWYNRALPRLEGLVRARTEKRISEVEIAQTGFIDLLRLIDPAKDSVATTWTLDGGILRNGMNFRSRLMIPYQPPDEYDLTIALTTSGEGNPTIIGLVSGASQFNIFLDGWGKSGIDFIDKKGVPLATDAKALAYGKESVIVCSVRKKGVAVSVNGTRTFNWEGPASKLSQNPEWAVPNPQALYIGAWDRPLEIRKIALTPVTGTGRRLH